MDKTLLFSILGWGFVGLALACSRVAQEVLTQKLPANEKWYLFGVFLCALWVAFLLGLYLHPIVTR
jgi:hypothetical protein